MAGKGSVSRLAGCTRGATVSNTPWPRRACKAAGSSQIRCALKGNTEEAAKRPLVRVPETRQAAEAPSPVAVQHSSSFLVRRQRPLEDDEPARPQEEPEEPFAGNALEWTLRKWDKSMKEQETNPSTATKTAWQVGGSPVGTAAGKGVSGAAKASIAICREAVKAAVPAGKWAVGKGLGLAWRLASGSGKKQQKRGSSGTD